LLFLDSYKSDIMSNIEFQSLHPTTPFDEALRRIAALSEYLDNINVSSSLLSIYNISMNDHPHDSIFPQELADTLISQNVWLIQRVRELEERIYNLESGAARGNGIGHQHQGQRNGGLNHN
jgi:hypothetical protein